MDETAKRQDAEEKHNGCEAWPAAQAIHHRMQTRAFDREHTECLPEVCPVRRPRARAILTD